VADLGIATDGLAIDPENNRQAFVGDLNRPGRDRFRDHFATGACERFSFESNSHSIALDRDAKGLAAEFISLKPVELRPGDDS
jgi:hypothetical protein